MTSANAGLAHDIAIVGGGAAGVLVAIQLLRQARKPLRIALLEPQPVLAQGVAYATPYPEHVLNVPAQKMSALPDQPDDFLDFVAADDADERARLAPAFLERRRYGDYLRARLAEAMVTSTATLEHVQQSVVTLHRHAGRLHLGLQDGSSLECARVVLAVGNRPRPLPARGASSLAPGALTGAWDFEAVRAIPQDASLCIVGSGLSMVDAVLSFVATGHRGRIQVLSRHGWWPQPHAAAAKLDFDAGQLMSLGLRARLRVLRRAARKAMAAGQPWQALMETLRPHGQALWASLSAADQRRFLRHLVRLWDVHRHRIASDVHARMQTLIDSGQLRVHRGRLDAVMQSGRCVRVAAVTRAGKELHFDVDHVINATGVELRVPTMRNALLTQMLGDGLLQPGPHGIGVATVGDGQVLDAHGQVQDDVVALGSLRVGDLWESTAIPELRGQAEHAARVLLA
ncbi:FAD/NAD(P)-binding protein [Pseudoxanthomonas indica]|uniref:Uncharacterized NAD(P)/FAD-binding protein YdhS n=1 Tax=Pseudoxanthomonas indica TaxID=428993 RepID=A0A1T5KIZ6_9GAMM|nr:FAD/NAD(P)-binding protein [Pseudoxanthomonas indica]GGD49685.1 pyridine nucleotide-disulfide oxidoreductase [Pseudoxanthomonas indica]SKC63692.1 Uncharacterized NAD(P)/FAD-binding protein YdhS [Pseudoxanthomonas indica]